MDQDERQLADLARRLGGRSGPTWDEIQSFVRNPFIRGLARVAGVDLDSLDRQHEQAVRSLVALGRATAILAPLGWAVSRNAPKGSDYEAAVELYDRTGDVAAVDELLTEAWGDGKFWIRRSFGPLPTLAGRHEPTRDILLKRNELLRKAFSHHEAGEYEASVLIVLTQIDGITYDLTDNQYGFFTAKGGDQFLDDGTVAGLPDNLRVVWKAVIQDEPQTVSSRRFRRSAIVHGRDLNFGTKTNSTKAFALLAAVLEWLKPRALELTEARQLAEEARWAGSTERDEDGRWRDRRGFSKAREALWMLRTRESNEFREHGRYRSDLKAMFPLLKGLMERRDDIRIEVAPDGQSYWAWITTDSDFCFGVAARDGKPDLLYADVGPPGPLGSDARWISELEGRSPDWDGG